MCVCVCAVGVVVVVLSLSEVCEWWCLPIGRLQ